VRPPAQRPRPGAEGGGLDGEGFDVATVSIDPAEKRDQLARYKQAMVREAGGSPGVAGGWRFLLGAKADVDALADAAGFKYRYDPKTGEFAHQATLVVVTGDGRVSGYLHGITYAPGALRTAVARAAAGPWPPRRSSAAWAASSSPAWASTPTTRRRSH